MTAGEVSTAESDSMDMRGSGSTRGSDGMTMAGRATFKGRRLREAGWRARGVRTGTEAGPAVPGDVETMWGSFVVRKLSDCRLYSCEQKFKETN